MSAEELESLGPTTLGKADTNTLEMGVGCSYMRSQQVTCADEPDNSRLPYVTKVDDRFRVRTLDSFWNETVYPIDHRLRRPLTESLGNDREQWLIEECRKVEKIAPMDNSFSLCRLFRSIGT